MHSLKVRLGAEWLQGESCSYHMQWLESKANTPTGVRTKTDDYATQGLASTI